MKKLLSAALLAILAYMAFAADVQNQTIRYRGSTVLKFDPQASVADEDGAWTITAAQLGKLSMLQYGSAATAGEVTNKVTFTTAFSAVPTVVLTAGTNDAPHLISVTTTNFVLGVGQTNATVRWIAIGSP